MNVRTEQQTDRQTDRLTARTSRLCGARSGSPQLAALYEQNIPNPQNHHQPWP